MRKSKKIVKINVCLPLSVGGINMIHSKSELVACKLVYNYVIIFSLNTFLPYCLCLLCFN